MLFPLISGGSLRNHVTRRKLLSDDWGEVRPWTERQVLTLFRGVLEGVSTLHRAGYAHCDVKLENVLLDGIGMMGVNNDNGRRVGDVEMNNQVYQLILGETRLISHQHLLPRHLNELVRWDFILLPTLERQQVLSPFGMPLNYSKWSVSVMV